MVAFEVFKRANAKHNLGAGERADLPVYCSKRYDVITVNEGDKSPAGYSKPCVACPAGANTCRCDQHKTRISFDKLSSDTR